MPSSAPDPSDVPLGTILPFREGEVPDGWEVLDGRYIEDCEDLDRLLRANTATISLWRQMGGKFKLNGLVLPSPTRAEATMLVFGGVRPEQDFVLAIRAKRSLIDDAGTGSQVHGDDPSEGQPG